MPTLVVSSRANQYDVYIGRGSKWGNPFSHVRESTAAFIVNSSAEAVARHREWILVQKHLLADLYELKDKVLGCPGCNPDVQECHGHILAELADALP